VFVLLPANSSAQDPIPSYGNNIVYLGSYLGNVEADEQYLTANIEEVGERGDNTSQSEWFHIFPHTSARQGIECKEMYFYQQPATDDKLYFDTTKDVDIIVHAEFDDTLVNLSAELQYGRDEGHNTVYGRDMDTDEDGDNLYHFSIRIDEEVLDNKVSLCLYIYYNVTVTESFEGTIHTVGDSYMTYPLLEPPEGAGDDDVDDDPPITDDDDDPVVTDDDVTPGDDDDVTIGDDDDTDGGNEGEDALEGEEDSPGFGVVGLILATVALVWGVKRKQRK